MKRISLVLVLTFFAQINLHAQTPEFWGMTSEGGEYNSGVIFKTDTNGNNYNIQKSLIRYKGQFPAYTKLLEASNGKLYGMVEGSEGSPNDQGVIFEYDTDTEAYTVKLNFKLLLGRLPIGSLIQASNGKLYGMTARGGELNEGVLFEYDIDTDTYTKKYDFDGSVANGGVPLGSLVQADNGKLYGMTSEGGDSDMGVLFEYDLGSNTYTKKLEFDGADKGSLPVGSLMEASNGKLYGMTRDGGTLNMGVLFEYDPGTDTYTKILEFDGTEFGSKPEGDLMQASNGKLYGMTREGGTLNFGVLFEYDPDSFIYTKKLEFDQINTGSEPRGSLIQADNGKLYGMTYLGGAMGRGVIFEYDVTTDEYTTKIDFDIYLKGELPIGTLMQASNGKLYGMTNRGGIMEDGVFFEYDLGSETFTKIFDFNARYEGSIPSGSLMQANNGKLYGMTSEGGNVITSLGVLFEYDPITSEYTHKFNFDGFNGRVPQGSLIQATNNKLYGMTSEGGSSNNGVLFEYDPLNDTYTKKLNFDGATKGRKPFGSLMQASNGKMYGMTRQGGASDIGVFFEYDPDTDTYTKILDLDGATTGSFPAGSLMEVDNGKLYGMTAWGGTSDNGVLFEYDLGSNIYTKKLEFGGTDFGSHPQGSLIQGSNGKLYGLTSEGGNNDDGVLFEYDPLNDTYIKKLDFDGTNKGSNPLGSLMSGSNGKLYGMTKEGGDADLGVLFEFDPDSETYTKKLDFDGTDGQKPLFGHLIEVNPNLVGIEEHSVFNQVSIYPNPNQGFVNIDLGSLKVVTIKVFNVSGQIVYHKENINTSTHHFKINEAPGVYVLEISVHGKNQQYKLVKK